MKIYEWSHDKHISELSPKDTAKVTQKYGPPGQAIARTKDSEQEMTNTDNLEPVALSQNVLVNTFH